MKQELSYKSIHSFDGLPSCLIWVVNLAPWIKISSSASETRLNNLGRLLFSDDARSLDLSAFGSFTIHSFSVSLDWILARLLCGQYMFFCGLSDEALFPYNCSFDIGKTAYHSSQLFAQALLHDTTSPLCHFAWKSSNSYPELAWKKVHAALCGENCH